MLGRDLEPHVLGGPSCGETHLNTKTAIIRSPRDRDSVPKESRRLPVTHRLRLKITEELNPQPPQTQ